MKFKCGTIGSIYHDDPTELLNHLRIMSAYRKTIVSYSGELDLSTMKIGQTVNVIYIQRGSFEYMGILNFYKRIE